MGESLREKIKNLQNEYGTEYSIIFNDGSKDSINYYYLKDRRVDGMASSVGSVLFTASNSYMNYHLDQKAQC